MKQEVKLTWEEVYTRVVNTFDRYMANHPSIPEKPTAWGVPRGGMYIVNMLVRGGRVRPALKPSVAQVIVDDVIDSGHTQAKWLETHDNFYATYNAEPDTWYVFPWEEDEGTKESIHDSVEKIIRYIGENPRREGIIETPQRVVRSFSELYAGYKINPEEVVSKFFKTDSNEMVICKDIEFYSMCEHHMLPFTGKAHIGYIPNGQVVGLSKLARLVDVYARRMQIQEGLTNDVASFLMSRIPECKGVGVVIEAKHMCMCSRGVNKQSSSMKTSSLKGCFKDAEVRSEFISLIS